MMKTIEHLFADVMLPKKALLVYQSAVTEDTQLYLEAYDMDNKGRPVNAHPLSIEECAALAQSFDHIEDLKKDFLTGKGLIPDKVLYLHSAGQGFAVWYTPPQKVNLLFKKSLSIPCGEAKIPAMIWKADRKDLYVYSFTGKRKPTINTPLFHAPFFNLYEDGRVCMGTVDIEIETNCFLEEFMSRWEHYFFDSYFSHVIAGAGTTKKNIVQLWQQQVGSDTAFPENILIKTGRTLKNIIA
jgi:PRTRC genetic system protein B